jgi:hypothetical protein
METGVYTMKKPDRPKTNEFGWVFAFLFPKKAKPIAPKPGAAPVSMPPSSSSVASAVPVSSTPPSAPPARPPAASPVTPTQSFPPPATYGQNVTQAPLASKPAAPIQSSPAAKPAAENPPGNPIFQPGKLLPAFWTVASVLSFIVNMILIVTLIILGQELFELKRLVGNNVLGGLYDNFVLMDQAHIKSQIKVQDNIPVSFTLPISQDTVVVLTEPTYITNVMINLSSGGLSINSPANITLPAGTNLPVHLNLTVPVDTRIPITLNVPIDIPLEQTELHKPFTGLQNVIGPYNSMLDPTVSTVDDVPICRDPMISWFCYSFFVK